MTESFRELKMIGNLLRIVDEALSANRFYWAAFWAAVALMRKVETLFKIEGSSAWMHGKIGTCLLGARGVFGQSDSAIALQQEHRCAQ